MFEKYGINNTDIILVESYPCENKNELHSRERYYIENNNCVNKIIPTRTSKEFKKEYLGPEFSFLRYKNLTFSKFFSK